VAPRGVEIAFARREQVFIVQAKVCVLACWNMTIPCLCPELPEVQKAALHSLLKKPLVYTSVALRNWRAPTGSASSGKGTRRLSQLFSPEPGGGYWRLCRGEIARSADPDPHVRTPCQPGLSEHDQDRAGRAELLATPFETFERNMLAARPHIGRRWIRPGPRHYCHHRQPLAARLRAGVQSAVRARVPPDQQPNVIGRARFGRISVANSDSGRAAYTDIAIDQAHRAVSELLPLPE
jgi:spermidine dehydrogenase